jgi:2,3-bisphosphoglycerate-independent phosphoglycerate mutase
MTMQVNVPRHPVVLRILDGSGINPSRIGNAVAQARTPRFDEYLFPYP